MGVLALAVVLALAEGACSARDPSGAASPGGPPPGRVQREFVMEATPSPDEPYSAWFAASDGRVLYLGLSPFWVLQAERGDPSAELATPGPHWIGRFDLASERFLEPLVVRTAEQGARGSVWDVLAHSNGRIYYTTFFQEMGSVEPDGSAVRRFDRLGTGLNELVEGERGEIVVTRYGDRDASGRHRGGVAWVSPAGELLREQRFPERDGVRIAPKSLAVDPRSGEVWLNADRFGPQDEIGHEWMRLDREGRTLERGTSPELLFAAFDRTGLGWFVWDEAGRVVLRVREREREQAHLELERRAAADFAQDLQFAADGRALVAFWSGSVHVVELTPEGTLRAERLRFRAPPACRAPGRRALLYTAIAHGDHAYATLSCGPTVLRLPLRQAGRSRDRSRSGRLHAEDRP